MFCFLGGGGVELCHLILVVDAQLKIVHALPGPSQGLGQVSPRRGRARLPGDTCRRRREFYVGRDLDILADSAASGHCAAGAKVFEPAMVDIKFRLEF